MRFKPFGKFQFEDTSRKRAAVVRKHKRQAEAFPLFAEEIIEGQSSVDEVMKNRAESWTASVIQKRSECAKNWLKVRAKLNCLPAEDRQAILKYWNNHRWNPGTPLYLSLILNMFSDGRYVRSGEEIIHPRPTIHPSEAVL